MNKIQKAKKSKHGKKNWRKNIDIDAIEKKQQKKNKEEIIKQTISNLKDEELFTFDYTKPTQKYLGRKKERKPKIRQISKNEQKKLKRIIEANQRTQSNPIVEVKRELLDIWGDNNDDNKKTKKIEITYPLVPIPHPGQSYNPNKEDLSKLLHKVVDLNKPIIEIKKPKEKKIEIMNLYNSDDDEDNTPLEHPVANNPKVDDTNRKTKKEKRLKEIKKQNILKNKQLLEKKKAKLDLHHSLSTKKILKEQKKKQEELEKKIKKEKENEKKKISMLKHGIIEDKEFLEDFQVKKEQVPLRKLKPNSNFLSDRWDNIIKRNVLGIYTRSQSKKANRKLKKIKYYDIKGENIDYNSDEQLEIIE